MSGTILPAYYGIQAVDIGVPTSCTAVSFAIMTAQSRPLLALLTLQAAVECVCICCNLTATVSGLWPVAALPGIF